ncbi:MAG: cysteine desulfurase [Bacteroidales bacterium]|nr:cysteine desulfurase [Bacteroidales bacterium]
MIEKIKEEFSVLQQDIYGKPLIYLDNAATTQKPISVLNAVENYYRSINSNVHRGVHRLSILATEAYEHARISIQQFLNAQHAHEIVFTRGTTESVNLVAQGFANAILQQDDEVIVSTMEHHSNIVPWQLAVEKCGAKLKVIPINEIGEIDMEYYQNLFSEKTKIVAVTHVSNVLGTINPIKKMIETAHAHQVPILIDGAQGIKSTKVDVQDLDCDFYCFSGHKIYAPMGIGVLYGKEKYLEQLPPYQGGGEMIKNVSFEKTTFNSLPFKFEAGTPNVGGAIGLEAAINFMLKIGIENLLTHDKTLLDYAQKKMQEIENIHFIGQAKNKAAVISFLLGKAHPADVGTLLDTMGIAVRTGHHCAEPLMNRYKIPGTVRASFAIYNTKDEIDNLVEALKKTNIMLS